MAIAYQSLHLPGKQTVKWGKLNHFFKDSFKIYCHSHSMMLSSSELKPPQLSDSLGAIYGIKRVIFLDIESGME